MLYSCFGAYIVKVNANSQVIKRNLAAIAVGIGVLSLLITLLLGSFSFFVKEQSFDSRLNRNAPIGSLVYFGLWAVWAWLSGRARKTGRLED
jgi:hypothetical protein